MAQGGAPVCLAAVSRAMRAMGWTYKKTPLASERDRPDVAVKRRAFLAQQRELEASRLIFIDESGFRLGSPPRFGWAPCGHDAPRAKRPALVGA